MVSLSAVVPATDQPPTLGRCLRAIEEAEQPPEEIIVVEEPLGGGPARARNAGADRATGELVAFVDADVEVHRDAFVRLRAAFARDPRLAAVFGSYDDDPAAPGVVSSFRNLLHHHVHQSSPGPALTFWAGLGAIRRDAFAAAGGFDAQRYRHASIEDVELGLRLSAAGQRCLLDPSIQGRHLKAWTLQSMVKTDFARRGVPWVTLLIARGDRGTAAALNLGWRHRLSAAAVLAGTLALATRRERLAGAALATLLVLNRHFYLLLARRRGAGQAVVGVGLHALHHLISIAAVPAGALASTRHR
jgi:cellulose synthase/poly-beta-1,6-N-acetylglucosamine synthase-like glycosyltransferase